MKQTYILFGLIKKYLIGLKESVKQNYNKLYEKK